MSACDICPRGCGVTRDNKRSGFCLSPALPVVARAAAHFWEEPCISGSRGSGAVFFRGCNLRCVYCQNAEISREAAGETLSVPGLRDVFLRLRDSGVHNINLVTPTHFSEAIIEALTGLSLGIPIVWNSSGYERVETLKRLEGLVQVYLPDLKYSLSEPARRYSATLDYPEVAMSAIMEMYRQTGLYELDDDGLMRSGVLIRHLVLPGNPENTRGVIDWVAETFPPGRVMFSLMGQYTPNGHVSSFSELSSPLSVDEYACALEYLEASTIEDGYTQEPDAAGDEYVPDFDGTGV